MIRLLALLTALVLAAALPVQAAPAKLRVLYLTQSVGWRHAPVSRTGQALAPSETAMIAIGRESGAFEAQVTQDAAEITPERLKTIDVLVFYTTGALPIPDAAWTAVQAWVASGEGGFVGLHSATDTAWPYAGPGEPYARFIGGEFAGHPWVQGTPVRIAALDPRHPTVAMWPPVFDYAEEIYQYSDLDPARVRVLQALDFAGTPLKRPYAVPVTWVRQIGKGRLFYGNLGHTVSTWDDPRFRRQIVAAVRWSAGRTAGSATPNPHAQALAAITALLTYDGEPGRDVAALTRRLARADEAWLTATAAQIAALRPLYPRALKAGDPPERAAADQARFEAAYRPLRDAVLAHAGG
ncbi:MAG: hypothetical protein JWP92_2280 [Caulobacter sp.]|nr:hypothetical protein [Caulobacter sp.]